jgi:hypothetical protein
MLSLKNELNLGKKGRNTFLTSPTIREVPYRFEILVVKVVESEMDLLKVRMCEMKYDPECGQESEILVKGECASCAGSRGANLSSESIDRVASASQDLGSSLLDKGCLFLREYSSAKSQSPQKKLAILHETVEEEIFHEKEGEGNPKVVDEKGREALVETEEVGKGCWVALKLIWDVKKS